MRGQPNLQERLEAADEILLPVTVLGEVYAGFQGGSRLQENHSLLAAFRSEPGVVIVDTTDNVAQRYAMIVATLKRQGTPIPTNDIWIAAAALENGGRIVAYDAHFEAVPGLIIEAPDRIAALAGFDRTKFTRGTGGWLAKHDQCGRPQAVTALSRMFLEEIERLL